MAKAQKIQATVEIKKKNISRPGVHAKTQTSHLKSSKNYKKLYRGQGR